jgi:hypothetical protein
MTTEELGPGRQVERDIDGKFKSVKLDPEVAREMGQKSRSGPRNNKIDDLLTSRGVNPSEADEGLRSLARLAISGKSGAVAGLRYLDQLCSHGVQETHAHTVNFFGPENCGVDIDGTRYWNIEFTPEFAQLLMDKLSERMREKSMPNTAAADAAK